MIDLPSTVEHGSLRLGGGRRGGHSGGSRRGGHSGGSRGIGRCDARAVGPAGRPPRLYLVTLGTRRPDRGPSDHARRCADHARRVGEAFGNVRHGYLGCLHVTNRLGDFGRRQRVEVAGPERTGRWRRRRQVRLGQVLVRRRLRFGVRPGIAGVDRRWPDEVVVRRTHRSVPAVAAIVHHCLPIVRHPIIASGARTPPFTVSYPAVDATGHSGTAVDHGNGLGDGLELSLGSGSGSLGGTLDPPGSGSDPPVGEAEVGGAEVGEPDVGGADVGGRVVV